MSLTLRRSAITSYTCTHHVPHTKHVESSIGQNGKVQLRQWCAVLCLSRSQVSEQSTCKSLTCWCTSCLLSHYFAVFHLFVKQLTVFYTSGLVLYPAVVFYPPSPSWCIMSGMCQKGMYMKLGVNPYSSIVNLLRTYIHTYIHTYIYTYNRNLDKDPISACYSIMSLTLRRWQLVSNICAMNIHRTTHH